MAKTNLDALKSVNAYPIPLRTLVETAERRNISLTADATQEGLQSKNFRLAKADLLLLRLMSLPSTLVSPESGFICSGSVMRL